MNNVDAIKIGAMASLAGLTKSESLRYSASVFSYFIVEEVLGFLLGRSSNNLKPAFPALIP